MSNNLNTVKIEALPVDESLTLPVEAVPPYASKALTATGKLEALANVKPTESAKLRLEEALQQRVARVVQAKAEKGDAMARYNANLRYTPMVQTFHYDGIIFRLQEILGAHEGLILVQAESTTGKVWRIEIPQMTEFQTLLFRGD